MEYAAHMPRTLSPKAIVVPLVALVVGAGVATGTYALVDDGAATTASKVIVVEQPAPGTADIAGKDEAATAAAISGPAATEIAGKDESATAAAIGQSSGVDLRGSKASASEIAGKDEAATAAAISQRTDPHGPGISLRNP